MVVLRMCGGLNKSPNLSFTKSRLRVILSRTLFSLVVELNTSRTFADYSIQLGNILVGARSNWWSLILCVYIVADCGRVHCRRDENYFCAANGKRTALYSDQINQATRQRSRRTGRNARVRVRTRNTRIVGSIYEYTELSTHTSIPAYSVIVCI